uniref:Uridine-cytidine kinase n=1 Tax=Neolamprologus brichardi TaxID=32507 RepID=A0A3Q4MHU5_NEOBR
MFIVRSSFVLYNANHTDAPSPLLLLPSPPINRCLHTIPGSGEDSLDRLLPPAGAPRRKSATSLSKTEPPLLRTGTRTIYTAGRPPWYDEHGAQSKEAFVIGLCGGSASGKTTVANKIIEALDVPWVVLLSMDSFYKVLSPEEQALAAKNDYNFDHPGAFDFELLVSTLRKLKQGKSVKIPVYDFTTHMRHKDWKNVYGASVIIFEGIMSFADKELLQLLDMKIFVDADSDIRLVRRLRRDITERGRDIEGVIKQYNKFVKPAFEQYIEPTMRLADIVVPRGGGNMVAIDLIVQHVHSQLEEVSHQIWPHYAHLHLQVFIFGFLRSSFA